MKYTTDSPEQTIKLGEKIGALIKGGDVIAFSGGLGAGKTTMTRGIAMGMGLNDDVISPTFSLMNEYTGEGISLYHFDMYRISTAEELEFTGFFDCLENGGAAAVEWSENIAGLLPENAVHIDIKRVSDSVREITITGDERF